MEFKTVSSNAHDFILNPDINYIYRDKQKVYRASIDLVNQYTYATFDDSIVQLLSNCTL